MLASVCRHRDETDLSGVALLTNCNGFVCCLSYSATTLIEFVLFPLAPLIQTFHFVQHTFELRIALRTADHDVVHVKTRESLESAANVPSHQTWFMSTTTPTQLSWTSDFHQRLGASIKP